MRIFSEYAGVLEADGSKMRVRTALQLINQVLDETLSEQDSEYDRETGWAVAWFEQFGMKDADYGLAETLATARAVSTERLRDAGIIKMGRGRVQLVPRTEMPNKDQPERDKTLTHWEIVQYLIAALEEGGGQAEAARLKAAFGSRAEIAKDLAYRLYTICERKGWAQDALSYNSLVVSWGGIETAERTTERAEGVEQQRRLI
jgi:putative DNA methylase